MDVTLLLRLFLLLLIWFCLMKAIRLGIIFDVYFSLSLEQKVTGLLETMNNDYSCWSRKQFIAKYNIEQELLVEYCKCIPVYGMAVRGFNFGE